MVQKMPPPLGRLKNRKRKSSSAVKNSTKASSRKRCSKSPRAASDAGNSSTVGGCSSSSSVADNPLERVSYISCECHQSAGSMRCAASPGPRGHEGKENDPRMTGLEADGCGVNGGARKVELEVMECEESGCTLFPDDDSNQILPVEQFFGNMDVVQDFPQKPLGTSSRSLRQSRRRHYYAREDSDEEEADGGDT